MLGELSSRTVEEVRQWIADQFEVPRETVDKYQILIAFHWVGDYEGAAWFLLRCRETGKLFEVKASHCSCYGFEGQFTPEETTEQYLKSAHFSPGYEADKEAVVAFIKEVL